MSDPLPLGWTQVRRKTRNNNNDDTATAQNRQGKNDIMSFCCTDPDCMNKNTVVEFDNSSSNNSTRRLVQGIAIFCLTDPDCDWFQGYLFVNDSKNEYYGLLGQVLDIDDCLQCSDGGYREIDLQINSLHNNKQQNVKKQKPYIINKIQWTGGDMMHLHNNDIRMYTETVYSGIEAKQRVVRTFASLIRNLQQQQTTDTTTTTTSKITLEIIHEIMPNVVVVTGQMQLWLPNNNE